jgi:g-D-glutamyl-meso-diaminopimelate peptidase
MGLIVQSDGPYGYSEMMEDLQRLTSAYPFIQAHTIGSTVLGREIPAIRLGSGAKEIHYNGSFHANEWITSLALMKFVEDFAAAAVAKGSILGQQVNELLDSVALWIVPMVNPDGVELVLEGAPPRHPMHDLLIQWNHGSDSFIDWKANARGVDLNDQFPAGWETEQSRRSPRSPGPRDYVGEGPLTEPEAQAMERFTRERDFQFVIAFHTQGEEIYWNYRDLEPPGSEVLAKRLGEVSGYEPIKLAGSDAGYKDWFIQEYRRPGFTVELGNGVNPLPLSQFPDLYKKASAIMLEGLRIVK